MIEILILLIVLGILCRMEGISVRQALARILRALID